MTDKSFQILKAMGSRDLPLFMRSELQQRYYREELLHDFANVHDTKTLIEYLERRDIPDFGWRFKEVFPVVRFLAAAASIYWLILMLDEVSNNKVTPRLRNWFRLGDDEEGPAFTFGPTEAERSAQLKHWQGTTKIDGEELDNFMVRISPTEDVHSDRFIMVCARSYIAVRINELVKGISPEVTVFAKAKDFKGEFGVHTPYEAICLALYEKACGGSAVRTCENPHCPNPVYIAKRNSDRKPRSDRHYCYRPGCRKWCYENLGRVRSARTR
jgi:hypothetical protein